MSLRLLDLYCKAGGATRGYQLAGFHVTGVDIEPQPNYIGDAFILADALKVPLDGYDAIHASPPCHDHVRSPGPAPKDGTGWLLAATRQRLIANDVPWVIENVPGAPMRADYRLCGCMFGLEKLARERWFETSWQGFELRPPCHHPERVISITGSGTPTGTWAVYGAVTVATMRRIMGCEWMSRLELSQAIPPAYTRFIGERVRGRLEAAV